MGEREREREGRRGRASDKKQDDDEEKDQQNSGGWSFIERLPPEVTLIIPNNAEERRQSSQLSVAGDARPAFAGMPGERSLFLSETNEIKPFGVNTPTAANVRLTDEITVKQKKVFDASICRVERFLFSSRSNLIDEMAKFQIFFTELSAGYLLFT